MKVESFKDWTQNQQASADDAAVEEAKLTGTSADDYAKKKGLDVKHKSGQEQSELINGGAIDSLLIDAMSDLERMTGFDFIITSGNDIFHQSIKSYKSNHSIGMALDIASNDLANRNNRLKLEQAIIELVKSRKYNVGGYRLGVINEYDRPTAKSTGGHFHFSLIQDIKAKDGKEFILPLSGINSYSQLKKLGNFQTFKHTNKLKSNKSRKYYKIYDKENRRMIVAKPKSSTLIKLYTRSRDKIGNAELSDGRVIVKSKNGSNDITSGKLGTELLKLFKKLK